MIIQEHNETYCRAEITDEAGNKQVARKAIVLNLEGNGDLAEIHLINLSIEEKELVLTNFFAKEENTLGKGYFLTR